MSYPQIHAIITGGVGTGKSTVCRMLRRLKIPTFLADDAVHVILKEDQIVKNAILEKAPFVVQNDEVDRKFLGEWVFSDPSRLRWLESLLHPLVEENRKTFLKNNKAASLVVSEIPLFFEVGYKGEYDVVVVTTCSSETQRRRALSRPAMTPLKLQAILTRQLTLPEKEARADYSIKTNGTKCETFHQLREILTRCKSSFDKRSHSS